MKQFIRPSVYLWPLDAEDAVLLVDFNRFEVLMLVDKSKCIGHGAQFHQIPYSL